MIKGMSWAIAGSGWCCIFTPKMTRLAVLSKRVALRDAHDNLQANGVKVVGVSMDTPDEHRAFKAKYELSFTLLSDPMGETIRAYGAWGKNVRRRRYLAQDVFDRPQGKVRKVYGRVTPLGHGDKVLADLKTLMK